jgi:hypothetical protein
MTSVTVSVWLRVASSHIAQGRVAEDILIDIMHLIDVESYSYEIRQINSRIFLYLAQSGKYV